MLMMGRAAAAAVLVFCSCGGAWAQQGGRDMTLAQLEARYRGMSAIHIEKCDKNGDQVFTPTEQVCVGSIYRVMYVDR